MKILRIRLHPFGGIADRTCDLHDGVNVIEGPNEFGKSTLNNALWNGLFTPTNLTPANLKKTMGRWYPRPGGDHAHVTIEFASDGKKWVLQKTWGAGASASLQSEGGAGIADAAKIQEQLLALLHRNEATWRHVLFVGQAQLAGTIQELPHYNSQNLLARSLHPQAYDHNPGFFQFLTRSGLPFKSHEQFKKADLDERSDLYCQLAQQVWNPDDLLEGGAA